MEKKKIFVLAGLGVLMLGIGAVQFMQSPAPPAKGHAKKHSDMKLASQAQNLYAEGAATKLYAEGADQSPAQAGNKTGGSNLADPLSSVTPDQIDMQYKVASRDPFDGSAWANDVAVPSDVQGARPVAQNGTKAPTDRPIKPIVRPSRQIGGTMPMPVGPDNLSQPGMLPNPGGPGGMIAPGQMPSVDDVHYTVSGTVNGKRQAAVFLDASGKQRLVRAGEKLDGDNEVVSVTRGKVLVRNRQTGKTTELKVDYTPKNDVAKSAPTGSQNGEGR